MHVLGFVGMWLTGGLEKEAARVLDAEGLGDTALFFASSFVSTNGRSLWRNRH